MSATMKLVDGELEYELPHSTITGFEPSVKSAFYTYEFTDYNGFVRMGRGPTRMTVNGVCTTSELETLALATQADTLYTLYYPSQPGDDLDRYYQRVVALPAKTQTVHANLHRYSIELHALDGHAYDADTGQAVT